MTETNHYTAAVDELDLANECDSIDPLGGIFRDRAQVHATLALVDAVRALTAPPTPIPTFTVACDCAELVPSGNGECVECGHFADFHEPHNGACTVIEHS